MEEQLELRELQVETRQLQIALSNAKLQVTQLREEKAQIQKCYDKSIQEVADSEAKREIVEKELRLAHDQIANMWQELDALRKLLENPARQKLPTSDLPYGGNSCDPLVTDNSSANSSVALCHLCQEKLNLNHTTQSHSSPSTEKQAKNGCPPQAVPAVEASPPPKAQKSRKSWLFGGKKQTRLQEVDQSLNRNSSPSHSHSNSHSNNSHSGPNSPSRFRHASSCSPTSSPRARRRGITRSPSKTAADRKGAGQGEEFLSVNVTRSSHGVTDMSPFKIVTKTSFAHFPSACMEVLRSQGDFQWLYSALQGACPERIVPPLRPPISLDATISEFQRFLSRLSAHKLLSTHHFFVVFLSGTAEELRALRAKHRVRHHSDKARYKPAVGRDTNSGPLVDAKDYLMMLEQNLVGLTSHLEQSTRRGRGSPMERSAHWFSAISDSEPHHTYLKRAAADLARTCEGVELHGGDSDEMLFIQNLQSLADYIRVAQDLLSRVEEAVDQYLYWDEEVTIIEAVNSSPKAEHSPSPQSEDTKLANDDSGVSDVSNSSNSSNNSSSSSSSSTGEGDHNHSSSGHMTMEARSCDPADGVSNSSERWAQASKKCADAKEHLEMMCDQLAEELSFFDFQKEKEIKQILMDYASSQLERHEKFQGKWFAMKFILDSPVSVEKRAIQFNSVPVAPSSPAPTPEQS